MRVVHLNTLLRGGAARAARRLHLGLSRAGVASTFLHAGRDGADSSTREWPGRRSPGRKLVDATWRSVRPAGLGLEPLNVHRQPRTLTFEELRDLAPDVVHLHWIADWFDVPRFLRSIPHHIGVVWTLHDQHPITGGCHYAEGCERFGTRCWPCPQVGTWVSRLAVAASHRALVAHGHPRLHLVADSHWLEAEARSSALSATARTTRTIHYGLDLTVFRPRDRALARAALGLPDDRPIVLFAAEAPDLPRKGLASCLRVIEHAKALGAQPRLITFGRTPGAEISGVHFGRLESDDLMSLLYSAADLFVATPAAEAFGQTCAEALACGTPVAAFAVGGIVDQVRDGENGLLAPAGDVVGLGTAIAGLLADPARLAAMRARARASAAAFDEQREVHAYRSLYSEVLD